MRGQEGGPLAQFEVGEFKTRRNRCTHESEFSTGLEPGPLPNSVGNDNLRHHPALEIGADGNHISGTVLAQQKRFHGIAQVEVIDLVRSQSVQRREGFGSQKKINRRAETAVTFVAMRKERSGQYFA